MSGRHRLADERRAVLAPLALASETALAALLAAVVLAGVVYPSTTIPVAAASILGAVALALGRIHPRTDPLPTRRDAP